VWRFKERLIETGRDKEIWKELQRQARCSGVEGKEGCNPGCNLHHRRSRRCKRQINREVIRLSLDYSVIKG